MAAQTGTTLKTYFNTGDQPTEAQFVDLIDSSLNLTDGGTVAGTTTMTGALNAQNATNYLGIHKFQGFVGTLAATNGGTTQYTADDILVELGTLDTTVPSGFVAATKFFFSEFIVGITTAAGAAIAGNLAVGSATGQATNVALTNPTEVCGAGVTTFHNQLSATQSITEVDINFNNTAGNYHVFAPYVTAAIARKHLYARTTTTVNADTQQAGRFTVAARYSIF
tara:strand:+ start:331 stop:1002 length:672 start_codon:yes stop_codon:yes gene_type:complete